MTAAITLYTLQDLIIFCTAVQELSHYQKGNRNISPEVFVFY